MTQNTPNKLQILLMQLATLDALPGRVKRGEKFYGISQYVGIFTATFFLDLSARETRSCKHLICQSARSIVFP